MVCGALGFLFGRSSAQPLAEHGPVAPQPDLPALTAPATSTTPLNAAACCACPPPKKPRARKKRRLARADRPPKVEPTAPPRDRSSKTAAYLKQQAHGLHRCAPPTGAPVRVLFEVRVTPEGEVQDVKITNLEPVPPAVSRCVLDAMGGLSPPPFDGAEALTFGLSVVL